MKSFVLKIKWLTQLILFLHKFFVLRKTKVKIGKNVFYTFSSIFEGFNAIQENSEISNCYLGLGTYIANDSNLKHTQIGKFSSIGPYVTTIFGNHPTAKFVSTHPAFFSTRAQSGITFTQKELFKEFAKPITPDSKYSIEIGNDVWIGAKVTILDGVKIGDGAIVASGALVNKNIAPYTVVGGVPAKKIKDRFNKEEQEFLLSFKWWEKDLEWIKKNASKFTDIKKFTNQTNDAININNKQKS